MDSKDYLTKLNEQQRAAVEYMGGAELVIAGAGSGKTRVLTYKILHLLNQGYEPWRILALTFTNKAAREMKDRIEGMTGPSISSRLWMGTFHSVFGRILRFNAERIGYKSNYTIYDSADSKALIKMIIKEMSLDEKIYKPSSVMSAISSAKNALISPAKYVTLHDVMEADKSCKRPLIHEIYRLYVNRCVAAGAMDFDDLLFNTYKLLKECPDVLRHYREFFRYVLVDEYQDTNFAQHAIVGLLTEGNGNLCVVGDDAQSIYSFRGAVIGNILNLEKSSPGMVTFKLEENYRSTQNIIEAANSLISRNAHQIRKRVFSRNQKGSKIEVVKCYSDLEEASIVASRISRLKMSSGDSYEEFAILYRTNAQSRQLEEALRKRNIAYRIWGGLSFYQRKEVKDAIAYFRVTVNPDDDEALRRIINYPLRGIGETTVKKLNHAAIQGGVSMWKVINAPSDFGLGISKGTLRKLDDFRMLIDGFRSRVESGRFNAHEMADHIIGASGIRDELMSDKTPETISRRENLAELVSGTREFVEERLKEGSDEVTLQDFLSQASLATDQDVTERDGEEMVTLMTAHASKGLEFGNIFIVGVEDELFPSALSKDTPEGVEEERRLLYVAITRAKRFCMLSYAGSRYRNGQLVMTKASPFLHDIDSRYMDMSESSGIGHEALPNNSRVAHAPGETKRYVRKPAQSHATSVQTSNRLVFNGDILQAGQHIQHMTFGRGEILEFDITQADHKMIVLFENDSFPKTLMLKFAKFTILD